MNLTPATQLIKGTKGRPSDTTARVLASVVRMYDANGRAVLGHTKHRSDVSGGGKKPWKQKGTGRARAGSTRSPLWRGGGTTHGPRRSRNYTLTLPASLRASALGLAVALKAEAGAILLIDAFPTDGKTRSLTELATTKTLLVLDQPSGDITRASRNLGDLTTKLAAAVTAKDVLLAGRIVGTDAALKILLGRTELTAPAAAKSTQRAKV